MTNDIAAQQRSAWQVPGFELPLWLGRSTEYCVIIPVINEGERIRGLVDRIRKLGLNALADVIIVDGGSTDGSLVASELQQQGLRGLIVKTGAGALGAQLRCGYAFALDQGYQGTITIDGNGKDDPEAIPRFIEALKAGVDFAQASRFIPGGLAEHTPRVRELAIRWVHAPLLSLCSGFNWTDTTQGFRAYSKRILVDPRVAPFRDIFSDYELLAYMSYRIPRLGYRCLELPTARRYPQAGKTPTKISGVRGNLRVLSAALNSCAGRFNTGSGGAARP